jgi:hypothetical protein
MPRWLTTTLDEDHATGLRALLADCELPVDDDLPKTRAAGMALAPEGPDIGTHAATQARLDTDRWIDEGGSLGYEATGLPGRRREEINSCDGAGQGRADGL